MNQVDCTLLQKSAIKDVRFNLSETEIYFRKKSLQHVHIVLLDCVKKITKTKILQFNEDTELRASWVFRNIRELTLLYFLFYVEFPSLVWLVFRSWQKFVLLSINTYLPASWVFSSIWELSLIILVEFPIPNCLCIYS